MRQVGYRASPFVADTGRMWTKSIWDAIPWTAIQAGEREGWVFFDDFINMPNIGDVDDTKYATFIDTNATVQQGAASEYGELVMLSDAGDNIGANITTGGQTGGLSSFILQANGVPHTIALEARWKTSTLVGSCFVGFAEEGLGTTEGILSNTGTIQDKDYLGWFIPEADPDGLDCQWNKESGTDVTLIADAHTVVADTYFKTGVMYHYKNANSKQMKWYINGVRQSTFTTKAQIDDTTNFPGGEEMCLMAAFKNVTDIKNLTMDWWRAALVVNA